MADVPQPAEWLGFTGVVLLVVGVAMSLARAAWEVWLVFGWWSGVVYAGAGVAILLLAVLSAWLYATGIPHVRLRYRAWKQRREQRHRQREQEQAQEGGD